jgi:Tol biopolymer transport system component
LVGVFLKTMGWSGRGRSAGVAFAVACLGIAVSASNAFAAFPGVNGRIAFSAYHGYTEQCPPGADESSASVSDEATFSMNPGGSDARQVTQTHHMPPDCYFDDPGFAFDEVPSYAPDGKRLAFNQYVVIGDHGGSEVDVEAINVDGTNRHLLATVPSTEYTSKPAFSPDGKWIAFVDGSDTDGPPTSWITVIRSDGTHERRVTAETVGRTDVDPSFVPSGKAIVFGSYPRYTHPPGPPSISRVRLDGTNRHTLVEGPVGSPDVSPDGSSIVFNRSVGGHVGVYTMWSDGTHQRHLANGYDPVFSPNGKRIAFASWTSAQFWMPLGRIIVMRTDGSDRHALTPNPLSFGVTDPSELVVGQPSWGPRP